jgi:hypothetical protein
MTFFFLTRHAHTVLIQTGIPGLDMGFGEPNTEKKTITLQLCLGESTGGALVSSPNERQNWDRGRDACL